MKRFLIIFVLCITAAVSAFGQSADAKFDLEKVRAQADAGDAKAMFALGSAYAKGENGVQLDAARALELLEKSAQKNFAAAQVYLGYLYGEGKIVKRDFKKAVYWREAGAAQGGAADKWSLGNAYMFGFFLPKDTTKAVFWITEAAEGGNRDAVAKLVDIYTQLKDAQNLAKWQKKYSEFELEAAKKGNPDAMEAVALKYMKGKGGFERNRPEAIYWYKRAADAGNFVAMEKVANMYAKGRFLPRNQQKAQAYFEKLAAQDTGYCLKIASYYSQGKDGFPFDLETAAKWYEKGAENSDISTKAHLAWKYWAGSGVPQNSKKAEQWCDKIIKTIPPATVRPKNQMEIFVMAMLDDIAAGKQAPSNFGDYVKKLAPAK